MQGNEDKKRFSVVMHWLASFMKESGGLPKKLLIEADPVAGTPRIDVIASYYSVLNDIRIERIEWGAKHLFKTTTWFPMPLAIREAAMLAPSSVLPPLPVVNHPQICEFSEEEIADAKARFEAIANGWEFKEAVRVTGCQRPVYQI
jgi:hypothetical protein